jgi:hypothetical protein
VEEVTEKQTKRRRSLTESLLSIVLALEAVLVFFVALAMFGLHALTPVQSFVGGGVLALALVVVARFVRFPAGVWAGWVLQAVLVATGVILPVMYFIGAMFLALWIYCFVRGRAIDRSNIQLVESENS